MATTDLRINRLYLALHTRDQANAESVEHVRLFLDGTEIVNFNAPPPGQGLCGLLEAPIDLGYEELVTQNITLGLTGVDPWRPRSAYLWGRVDTSNNSGNSEYVPLAQNLQGGPSVWVSQDLEQGVDRWPLYACQHLGVNDSLAGLVLFLETAPRVEPLTKGWWIDHAVVPALERSGLEVSKATRDDLSARWADVRLHLAGGVKDTGTVGPLDLSVRGYATDLEDEWVGPITFHTLLTRRGQQDPASAGAQYLAWFTDGFFMRSYGSGYREAFITNHSDDAWKPNRVWLFGLGGSNKARILGVNDNVHNWCSQESYPLDTTIRAYHIVSLHGVPSVLDD